MTSSSKEWKEVKRLLKKGDEQRRKEKRGKEHKQREYQADYEKRQKEKEREAARKEREHKEADAERKKLERANDKARREDEERKAQQKKNSVIAENKAEGIRFESLLKELSNLCAVYTMKPVDWEELSKPVVNPIFFADHYEECGLTVEAAASLDKEMGDEEDKLNRLANDVLSGESGACIFALTKLSSLHKNPYTKDKWKILFENSKEAICIVYGDSSAYVPENNIAVTSTGHLTETPFSKSKRNNLMLELSCGCMCLCIRDVLTVCPSVEKLDVIYAESRLNVANGRSEFRPLIWCECCRQDFERTDFDNITPSAFIKSLNNNMDYTSTKGLLPIVMTGSLSEIKQKESNSTLSDIMPQQKEHITKEDKEKTQGNLSGNIDEAQEKITVPDDFALKKNTKEDLLALIGRIHKVLPNAEIKFITRKNDVYVEFRHPDIRNFSVSLLERKGGFSVEVVGSKELTLAAKNQCEELFAKHKITPKEYGKGCIFSLIAKNNNSDDADDVASIIEYCKANLSS